MEMFVSEFVFPDQSAMEWTQALLPDALLYTDKRIDDNGLTEVITIHTKARIIRCDSSITDGIYKLRTVSIKWPVPQSVVSSLIAKQFAQWQGIVVGKQEQSTREFNQMKI